METKNQTQVVKDFKERSILVSREFKAPLASVWRAYTESELLDQWWGPKPWRAETKSMNFIPGGFWLYAMVGPEGEKHWGRMNYIAIDFQNRYDMEDVFCDENGNVNLDLPVSSGSNVFTKTENGTRVDFKMTYPTEKDLQTIVDMGFEEGITMCMEQLDQLFQENKI